MSTFFYIWRASDAARNLDLIIVTGTILAQFIGYFYLSWSKHEYNHDLAKNIYVFTVILVDVIWATMIGINSMVK